MQWDFKHPHFINDEELFIIIITINNEGFLLISSHKRLVHQHVNMIYSKYKSTLLETPNRSSGIIIIVLKFKNVKLRRLRSQAALVRDFCQPRMFSKLSVASAEEQGITTILENHLNAILL